MENQPQQQPDNPGVLQNFLNYFRAQPPPQQQNIQNLLMNQRNMLQNPPQEGEIQPDPNDPAAIIVQIAGRRELQQVREYNEEQAIAYLTERTYGKPIDSKYKMYCAAMLREYFDLCRIYDRRERVRLLEHVIRQHIIRKMREPNLITYDNIDHVKNYNDQQRGIVSRRHPWFFWLIQQKTLEEPENLNGLPSLPTSFNPFHWTCMITLGAMTGLGAIYLGYRVSRHLMSGTTTPPVQIPQQLHIKIDTPAEFLTNTTQKLSNIVIDTFENLETQKSVLTLLNNIAQRCIHLVKESCTSVLVKTLEKIEKSSMEWNPSPK